MDLHYIDKNGIIVLKGGDNMEKPENEDQARLKGINFSGSLKELLVEIKDWPQEYKEMAKKGYYAAHGDWAR